MDRALLEKNLEKLEGHQPLLVKRLRARLEELGDSPMKPIFRETPNGKWVSGITESPFFEKEPAFNFKHVKVPVYALFGIGTPPYLFKMLKALPQEALAVIVVEPSLDLILHTLSLTSAFMALPRGCRLCFLVSDDRPLMDELMDWTLVPMGIFPAANMHSEYHGGEVETVPELKNLGEFFRTEVVYRLTLLGNSPEDTLLGFRHAVLNTPRILKGISMKSLKDAFGGRPFICVAAGPSLEKNVDLIKGMENKCVIVACDTVLLPLLRRGIVPHVVTTIERPYLSYKIWCQRVLDEYPDECHNIVLLSQSVSYPMTAGRWPGPVVVIGKKGVPVDEWYVGALLHRDRLYSGLSVAHMALTLAIYSEASSVALIGQDLAYAPSGETHVGGAVGQAIESIEKSKARLTVPASMGGTVETHDLWLTFIQIFERIIAATQKKVYDCTEGGALIKGTEVISLVEYLEEHVSSKSFEPVDLSYLLKTDRRGWSEERESILARIDSARGDLEWCVRMLDEMDDLIEGATAPALPPSRRRDKGFKVAELLDKIHAANPVLSFIGQSYTYLAGTAMAETRMMDNVESVSRWERVHREIVRSHRANVAFLDQWLNYARSVVPFDTDTTADRDSAMDLLEKIDGTTDKSDLMVALSELLCRMDPVVEGDFGPEDLWSLARFLSSRGRSEEACLFMAKGASLMEDTSVPVDFAGRFLRDWAVMSASHDLCRVPNLEEAMELASNAMRYLPDDEDLKAIMEEISSRNVDQLRELSRFFSDMGETVRSLKFSVARGRNKAELAIRHDDLVGAMDVVRDMILDLQADESHENFVVAVSPFVEWLATTSARCLEASDGLIVEGSKKHLDWLAHWIPTAGLEGLIFPTVTVQALEKFGLKVWIDTAETETSQ
ncbi:protein of unknown function DUF115 [Dethiosulfovibrio peptidovorans DSM 11002]|uniref:6-hydroxymethylpterin diphosphokinase MptE-like domain-containing protein n=1 Tax=Dethiosulfovibrio peptidovorans DSM 11002 TaxID=469381 RepID=D2Z964_9BACT|nr:protein of unknown function DUF115 [Dethiosulfovibrio peptidovorans DSM 11002]